MTGGSKCSSRNPGQCRSTAMKSRASKDSTSERTSTGNSSGRNPPAVTATPGNGRSGRACAGRARGGVTAAAVASAGDVCAKAAAGATTVAARRATLSRSRRAIRSPICSPAEKF
ncbi:hypothetical protein Vafri_9450, partial [Volvox africanus]